LFTAASPLSARLREPRCQRSADPQHRSIIVIDVANFGRRTDLAQLHVRTSLDEVVRAACRASRLPLAGLAFEDRGDGLIVFVPATVSKAALVQPFLPSMETLLHSHNAKADVAHRIRVRIAVHAGEVVAGPHGWIGTDLNLTCRLVDSVPLREELVRRPRADLVVALSDVVHRAVVRHGHRGIDASAYREVPVNVKEVATRAWIHSPVREDRHTVTTLHPASDRHFRSGTPIAAATS
jgi:class 3 adenylate cyclase